MTTEQINKLTDELMVEIEVLPTEALIDLYKKIEAKLKDVETKINSAVNKEQKSTLDKLSESMAVPAHEVKEEVIPELKPKMAEPKPYPKAYPANTFQYCGVGNIGCLNEQERRAELTNIRTQIEGCCCYPGHHNL